MVGQRPKGWLMRGTDKMTTGRFAPSPSGRMHLGNAFSALLAWLSVRSVGGRMILRLEDLDTDRCKRAYCDQIEEDYRWLGLDWDEGGSAGGDCYYQSHRSDYYAQALNKLEEAGLIYPCFCTRGQLHAASAPHRSDGTLLYAGTCRNLTQREQVERAKVRRPAMRIRVPEARITVADGVQGRYSQILSQDCGDFILRRSDGIFAYQLAVVVDDALMGVNQVVRGEDLLSSTPRQLWLQQVLGYDAPEYYHVPLLYGEDGHRLSKRQKDMDLGALRDMGRRPEEIVGQLAFWAGLLEKPEPVRPAELVSEFDWKKVRKEPIIVR